MQEQIPTPKQRRERTTLHVAALRLRDPRGRTLVERRCDRGLWAGLWQPPSLESHRRAPARTTLARLVGLAPEALVRAEAFEFLTTHRAVQFVVWGARAEATGSRRQSSERRWLTRAGIAGLPLAAPHRKILLGEASAPAPSPRRGARAAGRRPGLRGAGGRRPMKGSQRNAPGAG
jgi:A/G-specific adenine glycosylase